MIVERVVSVHFPKAAGSSLKKQFSEQLGDLVAFDYAHDPLTSIKDQMVELPKGKRLIHGHFRPDVYALEDSFLMTFLRDPVENLISIYFFWRNYPESGNPVHLRFLREQPAILEFAKYPGISRLMSETYFGGFDMNRIDFVGFYESRESDMKTLSEALGLSLSAHVHENRTALSDEREGLLQDRVVLARLRDALIEDSRFYETLRSRTR